MTCKNLKSRQLSSNAVTLLLWTAGWSPIYVWPRPGYTASCGPQAWSLREADLSDVCQFLHQAVRLIPATLLWKAVEEHSTWQRVPKPRCSVRWNIVGRPTGGGAGGGLSSHSLPYIPLPDTDCTTDPLQQTLPRSISRSSTPTCRMQGYTSAESTRVHKPWMVMWQLYMSLLVGKASLLLMRDTDGVAFGRRACGISSFTV